MTIEANRPELSSLASMLDDVTRRLVSMAEDAAEVEEPFAVELFEIERGLQGVARRLAKLVDELARR